MSYVAGARPMAGQSRNPSFLGYQSYQRNDQMPQPKVSSGTIPQTLRSSAPNTGAQSYAQFNPQPAPQRYAFDYMGNSLPGGWQGQGREPFSARPMFTTLGQRVFSPNDLGRVHGSMTYSGDQSELLNQQVQQQISLRRGMGY